MRNSTTSALANGLNEAIIDSSALVLLVKSKSEKDFCIFYDKYSCALFGILFKIVRRNDVAEDLLQEVFVKIWRSIDSFDPSRGSLFTWMLNIARNQAIDYLRSNSFKMQRMNIGIDSCLHFENKGIDAIGACDLEFDDVKNKIMLLETKYAAVIDLIFFYGWTHGQTAKLLNLPIGTVKTRARKGIGMLKAIYQE